MKRLPQLREYHSPVWSEPIIMEMSAIFQLIRKEFGKKG
jgi:hypothetical protein